MIRGHTREECEATDKRLLEATDKRPLPGPYYCEQEAREFARRYGFERSAQDWRRRRVTGDGPPFYKVGARVMYREADLLEWIAGQLGSPRRSTTGGAR